MNMPMHPTVSETDPAKFAPRWRVLGRGWVPASAAWLVTFADLISLMLTFLVMLYATMEPKQDRWQRFEEGLPRQVTPEASVPVRASDARGAVPEVDVQTGANLEYVTALLSQMLPTNPVLADARVTRRPDRVVVALPGDLLFAPGRATLSDEAARAIDVLGNTLGNLPNGLGVSGHTDPTPLGAGAVFADNWELSLARAAAVAKALEDSSPFLDERAIVPTGHAATYFADTEGLPEADRMRQSRRVDVHVLEARP